MALIRHKANYGQLVIYRLAMSGTRYQTSANVGYWKKQAFAEHMDPRRT